MLDRTQHEINLKRILRDMYQDPALPGQLAFKGGTCLYMFYDLDRFSVDLDFSIINNAQLDTSRIATILRRYAVIEEESNKHFTWFFLASFEKGKQKIKVEISKRPFPDTYDIKDFLGINISCLDRGSLFAHKLCALTDRTSLKNRDLYDAHFMFTHNFPIRAEIIRERTGQDTEDYLSEVKLYIEKNINKNSTLEGLGELLTPKQKDWVKSHLVENLLFELSLRTQGKP